jgi:hypothetical protein
MRPTRALRFFICCLFCPSFRDIDFASILSAWDMAVICSAKFKNVVDFSKSSSIAKKYDFFLIASSNNSFFYIS